MAWPTWAPTSSTPGRARSSAAARRVMRSISGSDVPCGPSHRIRRLVSFKLGRSALSKVRHRECRGDQEDADGDECRHRGSGERSQEPPVQPCHPGGHRRRSAARPFAPSSRLSAGVTVKATSSEATTATSAGCRQRREEVVPGQPVDEEQRHQGHGEDDRRPEHGPCRLERGLEHDPGGSGTACVSRGVRPQPRRRVVDVDDRVVDDRGQGHDEPRQHDHVERLAGQVDHECGHGERQHDRHQRRRARHAS